MLDNNDYIGKWMDEADTPPTNDDITEVSEFVLSDPYEYDFTLGDIIKRCVEVFGMDQQLVELCVALAEME